MKIGKYISELLFENDFVILPELGEFSTKYIPAKFIPELKKVESPSKKITFSEKNKTGGGLLIEYIASKEGIGSQQAKGFVFSFVSEMQNSMRSGKKVELESIGVFSMDQAGNIVFEPDNSINYLSDSVGMKSVSEPEKKSEDEAKSELDKVMDDVKSDVPPPPPPAPSPVVPPVSAPPPMPPEPVAEEPAKPEPAKEDEPEKETVPPVEPPATPRPVSVPLGSRTVNINQPKPEQKERARPSTSSLDQETSGGGLPPALKWVAFTVVPILVIVIIIAFNFEFIFGEKSIFRDRTEAPAVTVSEPVTVDEARPLEPEPAPVEAFDPTQPPPAPESGRPVFYIIVGSFEEEHSALILAEELRTQGARTASVFPPNRQGFYRVSFGYYYDLREAENMLESAKEINPQAWILHR